MTPNAVIAFRVGNFKAFADTQRIPIRPLTLIYGPNSAGKSSIIHSLLLARHGIDTGELDVYRTKVGGETVDLGGFGQYVYRRKRNNVVEWAVELDPKQLQLGQSLSDLLKPVQNLTVGITIGSGFSSEQMTLFGGFARELDRNNQVRVESFSLLADGQEVLNMSLRRDGKLILNSLDYTHPLIKQVIDDSVLTIRAESQPVIEEAINKLVPKITAQIFRLLPESILVDGKSIETGSDYWQLRNHEEGKKQLADQISFWLPRVLQDLIRGITESVEREMRRLRYLGPFRSYPPRHFAFARQQDANWEAGGGNAWDTLLINHQVRERVNAWLGDSEKMKTPYQLVVRDLIPSDGISGELGQLINKGFHDLAVKLVFHAAGFGSDIQEEVQQLASDLEASSEALNIDLNAPNQLFPQIQELISILTDNDMLTETWADSIIANSRERLPNLILMDTRSNTPVSHRDVGIGVSQVIPILVYAYGLSNALVAIEQPEIHLHPRLQAELGDVFIESALGQNKNTFIIETHSENLLLRIMRRMRQTFNEELPKGIPPVKPEDVCVLYIEPVGSQSVVREMPLNECGELVEAWPGGFFEEGLEEVFS